MKFNLKGSLFLTILICNVLISFAQQDITSQYLKAKELLKTEKYDESIKIFTDLFNKSQNTDFAAYCKYLSAFGHFKKNNMRDANFILFQLITKNPTWGKIDLAYLLKGVIQLEGKSYVDALTQFSKISDQSIKKKADLAIMNYADRITTDSLVMLNLRFKDNKGLKDAYAKRTFTYKEAEIVTKSAYNVALLLPTELASKNRFVYELNAGIDLANDSLNRMGIKINIHPYDTGKDSIGVQNFINSPDADCFDLVIGPLYSNQQKLINEYSLKYNIPVVNPLSNNYNHGLNNLNYFLLQSSVETIGKSAAEFAFKNFNRKPTAIIVYGTEGSDSLIAKAYKTQFEQLGGVVLKFKKLSKSSSANFSALFSKIKIDSVGHIFVMSKESSLAANVFTTLEGLLIEKAASYKETLINNMLENEPKNERKLSVSDIPVLTTSKWLEFESISYEQFTMHNTHFIQPEFTDTTKVSQNFEKKYFQKYEIPASIYAKLGYNLLLNFGIYLNSYGIYFPKYLSETQLQKAPTLSYQDYSISRDNGYVPIVKIENYQLKLANKPFVENDK